MSRIFEALQRSESERVDFTFPEPPGLVAELLRSREEEKVETPAAAPLPAAPAPPPRTELGTFPTIKIALTPASRMVSITDKEGLAAEKFRFLSVRLRQLQQSRKLKKLLITSTLPEEGKSLVSGNLAATLARRKQQKILLIEGDLRRPVQMTQFGLAPVPGLTEWLRDGAKPMSNIYFLEGAGFWLLPAGNTPENPLELMQAGKLPGLMDQLASFFDWIVIDSPPLLPLADTSVWSRQADGILIVVREGRTERQQLERGLAQMDKSRLLGAVVNSCNDTHHQDYYSRYSYTGSGEAQ
jgi:protein-tyrosine kinase